MKEVRVGDIGTKLRITIKDPDGVAIDISSATLLRLDLESPDETVKSVTPTFYTDGTDGVVQYRFVDGDIDVEGIWTFQVYLEASFGDYRSTTNKFKATRKYK